MPIQRSTYQPIGSLTDSPDLANLQRFNNQPLLGCMFVNSTGSGAVAMVANTWTRIPISTFGTVISDPYSMLDQTNNLIVFKETGLYWVKARCQISGGTSTAGYGGIAINQFNATPTSSLPLYDDKKDYSGTGLNLFVCGLLQITQTMLGDGTAKQQIGGIYDATAKNMILISLDVFMVSKTMPAKY